MAAQEQIALYNTPDSLSDAQLVAYGQALNKRRQTPWLAGAGAGLTWYALASSGLRNKLSKPLLLSSLAVGVVSFHLAGNAVTYSRSVFSSPVDDPAVLRALYNQQLTLANAAQGQHRFQISARDATLTVPAKPF